MNAPQARPAAELVTTDAGLMPLLPGWRDLAAELGRPAAHPEWVLAMPRPPGTTRVVATYAPDGTLSGIMPLRTRGRPWGTELVLLGAELAEGFALMARPGAEDALVYAATATLREYEPHLAALRLGTIAAADEWPRRLVRGAGWSRPVRTQAKSAPFIALEAPTADAWLAGQSKNFRQAVAKAERRLASSDAEVRRADALADLTRALDAFARLHRLRWVDRGGSGVLTPAVEAAIRRAAHVLLPSGNLRLWTIQHDDRISAALLCLTAGRTLTTWLGGFDAAAAALDGGFLLRVTAVRDAYELGCGIVDLGTGETDAKQRFATGARAVESVAVHEAGWRGATAALATAAEERGRHWKRTVPGAIRQRVLSVVRERS